MQTHIGAISYCVLLSLSVGIFTSIPLLLPLALYYLSANEKDSYSMLYILVLFCCELDWKMENKIFVMNTHTLFYNLFAFIWQPFDSKLISLTTN